MLRFQVAISGTTYGKSLSEYTGGSTGTPMRSPIVTTMKSVSISCRISRAWRAHEYPAHPYEKLHDASHTPALPPEDRPAAARITPPFNLAATPHPGGAHSPA